MTRMLPAPPPTEPAQGMVARAETVGASRSVAEPKLVGGICAVAVVSLFLWIVHNRYLPITEGWFSYYGKLMHDGKLPYRDFYFFTNPISLLISWAVYNISDKMIYMRYYGVVERVFLTAALYFLISRRFSAGASFWASVVSMLVFLSSATEAFFTYLVTCCLFFVVGLICLQLASAKGAPAKMIYLFFAGMSASLAFFSKQSNGLFVTAAVGFLTVTLAPSWKQGIRQTLVVLAGWTIPAAGTVVWLRHCGLMDVYLDQVFRGAAAAKGGFLAILFAFLLRAVTPFMTMVLVVLAGLVWRIRRKRSVWFELDAPEPQGSRLEAMWFAFAAAACVIVPYFLPIGLVGSFVMRTFFMAFVRLLFWGSLAGFLICLRRLLRRGPIEDPLISIMIVGGFSWAYACGLSYEVEQQAVLVLLCLGLAFGYDALRSSKGTARRNMIVAAACCVFLVSWQKYGLAYQWTGWREAISHNPIASHWPRLAGYRTDPKLMGMFDTILDDVSRYSKPGEPIFTFPHMPMFNFVADRPQPTFAVVHYWDVCPDWVAQDDALRVREARPRVIVEMHFREKTWRIHEEAFR